MFALALRWGMRDDDPVKGVERYHEERRERWLSDAGLKRLLEVLAVHPNRCAANAVRFQLLTGARSSEVLTARWSEVDFGRGVWTKPSHHTKQKRTQHLPLSAPAPALALLSEWRRSAEPENPYLYPGDAPSKSLHDIKNFWRNVTKQADLAGYRLHDSRHTHASHLVSSGLSLEIVGRLLGHTNPLTTKRYAHLADDPLRVAAERIGSKMAAMHEADDEPLWRTLCDRRERLNR